MKNKRYQTVKAQLPADPLALPAAIALLKQLPAAKFDETVELHIRLGVNAQKSDQMVRGTVSLPGGTPRPKRVVVFAADKSLQKAALEQGALEAGGEELIEKIIAAGALDADVTIATPDLMPKLAKAARLLGPKGLMPNPKTGTVTPDPLAALKDLQGGKISFKMDQLGNIHEAIGKLSWAEDRLLTNAQALLTAVAAARPATSKGQFIKKVVLASTMSPSLPVAL
jgi:large subunit ribosomal protein L1